MAIEERRDGEGDIEKERRGGREGRKETRDGERVKWRERERELITSSGDRGGDSCPPALSLFLAHRRRRQ